MDREIFLYSDANISRLQEELDKVQAKCTARTLTAKEVCDILSKVEKEIGVPKGKLKGTIVCYTGAEHFANAYKYAPVSTWFTAQHNGRYWVIFDVYRWTCPNRQRNTDIKLSEETKTAYLEKIARIEI